MNAPPQPDALDICILDASTRGLLAMTASPPKRGEFVEIVIGNHRLLGLVKWAAARRFGVALHDRISVIALASGEAGSLTLEKRQARQARETRRVGAPDGAVFAQRIQFALLAALGLAGAWLLMEFASDGLAPLADAKHAMAGEVPVRR